MLRPVAVDGKTVRGSRTTTTAAIRLLAAMDHRGMVLAQRQVSSKNKEIPSFQPLLDGLGLDHVVITTDAQHTQHGNGSYLTGRGTHYPAVAKRNHLGLYTQVKGLPWRETPLAHRSRGKAHHRYEIRRLKVAASPASTIPAPARRSRWCAGAAIRRPRNSPSDVSN